MALGSPIIWQSNRALTIFNGELNVLPKMETVLFESQLMEKIMFLWLLLDFSLLNSLVEDLLDMSQLSLNCQKVLWKTLLSKWNLKQSLEQLFSAQTLLFNKQFSSYPKSANLIARTEEFVWTENVSAARCILEILVKIKSYPLVHSAYYFFYLLLD